MKTFKILLAAVICATCTSLASAQTTIRLTGSTAYRANTHAAITHILNAGFTFAFSGANLGGSQYAVFHGTSGGNSVTIKTSWTGSEGGIQTVSHQDNVLFYADSVAGTVGGQANVGTPSGGNSASEVPDVAMSDTFQSSSQFFGLFRGQNYPTLSESPNSPVGVVPFKFVVAKTSAGGPPVGLTNLTSQLAKALFGSGQMALSLFTGNNADETFTVFATGRDPDSGTRLTALAETGVGAVATVKQYQPQNAGNAVITTSGGTIDHFAPWPASVVNGIPVSTFNGGYASGGQLAAAMGNNTPASTTVVTYLGTNDANGTAIPAGAVELSYNGVTLGGNSATDYNTVTALTEGKYTFWGYEHLYYRNGTGGVVKTVADAVANQLKTTDAVVLISSMKVSRTTDGGKVTQNF
jgi:hypothetical protein